MVGGKFKIAHTESKKNDRQKTKDKKPTNADTHSTKHADTNKNKQVVNIDMDKGQRDNNIDTERSTDEDKKR